MKNYVLGPKHCHGTTLSPENWITRSIPAAWLVSFMAFHFFRVWVPFPYTFFDFYRGIQGVRFSTNSAVACPPMSLPSTSQTQLGRAVLGSKLFVLIFIFCQILGTMWRIGRFVIYINGSPIPPLAECVIIVNG